jgi:hypothetical protein
MFLDHDSRTTTGVKPGFASFSPRDETEEEALYPAAILVGRYLRARLRELQ